MVLKIALMEVFRVKISAMDTPHDILVDVDAKGSGDFLRDPGGAEPGIVALHLQDKLDELWRWAFGLCMANDSIARHRHFAV